MNLIIHEADCPALTWIPNDRKRACCAPPTAEQLRELVEAANQALELLTRLHYRRISKLLDAALEPFQDKK